jgi:hypothetical protein
MAIDRLLGSVDVSVDELDIVVEENFRDADSWVR